MEQGEVWWVRLGGEAGIRPAVILTRSWIIPRLTHITVAPLTRSVRNIPTHVRLSAVEDGVHSDCAANLDNIQTVSKDSLMEKVVRLRQEKLEQIFAALRVAFDIP
jgi:mRNA interferase MazF